ncbi:MAG: hypothetical protein ACJ789_01670 [Thermomicrobiales bacterium]
MEDCSLHPLDLTLVQRYVAALKDSHAVWDGSPWAADIVEQARVGYANARVGDENGAIAIGFGLSRLLSEVHPSFYESGLSLTTWEARIDRGIGMLIRPPSRFFIEAGLDQTPARTIPIRLDLSRGMMAGAYVPATLIDKLYEHLDGKFERIVKRMIAAELDAAAAMTQMWEAVKYARAKKFGLYEAIDAVSPYALDAMPPSDRVVVFDKKRIDPDLKKRLEVAAKPAKQPSRLGRLMRPRG